MATMEQYVLGVVAALSIVGVLAIYWALQSPARIHRMNSWQRVLWVWCNRIMFFADPLKPRESVEQQIPNNKELVGKTVVALSPLKPHGVVELNASQYSAVSQVGTFVEAGERLVVVGTKGADLIVRPITNG
jgi:membrane-bound ClpP family serine protease